MDSTKHRKTLAVIFLVMGGLKAFGWFVSVGWFGGDWLTLIYATLFLMTGWNLQNDRPGTKVLGVVSSILCLGAFPIGTVIGIYGLWYFLMNEDS
ncbi:MAG: hypothetical protein KDB79_01295 [Acidobacteria bacterium]|nr:hypothetical protein [Acidobacteriota bacterium]